MDDDIDGIPLEKEFGDVQDAILRATGSNSKAGAFIPSKWETVDPEQVEAQAITTSKWDTLDPPEPPKFYDSNISSDDEDNDEGNSLDYNEAKRSKLREIEVKTMQYQDEIESGKRDLKPGLTLAQQVENHRKKLLRKRHHEHVDSPLSYIHGKEQHRSESPIER